ncbi:MAG: hypothetical protein IT293_17595 [Deltaproteobacteria bacterium]|nr:hypothetical protein [Deltaproteobacteria bacterium]
MIAILSVSPGSAEPGPSVPASFRAGPPAQFAYTVTDLGTLGGASEAHAISENGKVAGMYNPGGGYQAFLWDDGVMTGLGTLGGSSSEAHGVNDAGQVVGYSVTGNGRTHAFLWQNGAMQDLGTFPGGLQSHALAINNAGQIAGHSDNAAYKLRAFRWSGGMADLGSLGGDGSWGNAINESGQVAGFSTIAPYPDNTHHAYLWNGGMQDLGTGGWAKSLGFGMNDHGDVVGRLVNAGLDDWHAFVSQGGGVQDLGGTNSTAYDINNAGLIVGESGAAPHVYDGRAMLWENGQMKNLNSLIDPGSGWVLQSARAINEQGHIVGMGSLNGQTRAFLLEPGTYYWINPSGGSWHTATNWDPQGDPGRGAAVVFALNGQYTIDAGPRGRAGQFPVGRMIVSDTNTVDFNNLALNLLNDSVTEPALTVNDGATVKITSGTGTYIHAVVGGVSPANPLSPPTAHLWVFNGGTTLNGTGRLSIGDKGPGDLFVANGGQLSSAESRLGGLSTAPGTAVVGGDGSLWETGNIAVGHGTTGELTIESGGRVSSNDGYVSFGAISDDSRVDVEGIGLGNHQASLWALSGNLFIGQSVRGFVSAENGGDVYVGQDVHIKEGSLWIEGRHANGDPSELDVLGSVFVGGVDNPLLYLSRGAEGDIEGDLHVGKDGGGVVALFGFGSTTRLDVVDPQAGLCVIGREFDGEVGLDDGGSLRCRIIQLGWAGTNGAGAIGVDGGVVHALEVLRVGQVGGGGGVVRMQANATITTDIGMNVAANGTVSGSGTLQVGSVGLINDGTIDPGITVLSPIVVPRSAGRLRRDAATPAVGRSGLGAGALGTTPGTIVVDGDFTQDQAGVLVIEVGGSTPGAFDVLDARGAVRLGGTLTLRFLDGYLPQPGDAFAVLPGKKFKGVFDAVEVENVGPGFDFALAPTGAALTLTARSAATPPPCRDPADGDADGVTCADNCPAVGNADQADADGDRNGDACDACTGGSPVRKPVLGLKKEKLVLKGALSLPGAPLLQPAVTGARVTVEDGTGAAVATFDAPPGAFDAATKTGWKKLAYTSRTGGLRGLKIGQAKKKPAAVKITLKAVLPGIDPSTIVPPVTARILLEGLKPTSSLCGQVRFAGPPGVNPVCALKRGALDCRVRKSQ